MKKEKTIKKYVSSLEDLNEEERKYNKISYRRLIDRISNTIYLFNEAPKLCNYDFEYELNSDYNEEEEEYIDIYQYYLIDIDYYTIEKLKELKCKDVIIAWSETLQNYVLMVDHFGTSWDYVLTDIEPTTDFEKADL